MHRHDPILDYELVLIGFDNYINESLRMNTLYCAFSFTRIVMLTTTIVRESFRFEREAAKEIELWNGKKTRMEIVFRWSLFGIRFFPSTVNFVDHIRVWSRLPKNMMKHVWCVFKPAHCNEMTVAKQMESSRSNKRNRGILSVWCVN